MTNTVKLKRGSGSDPGSSDLSVGELAIRTDEGKIFTKKDDGSVAEISGGGGVSDGDKGDITVSSSGATWTIDSNAITRTKITDGEIISSKLDSSAVTTSKINDNSVTYAKIQNVSATDRILGRDSSGAGDIEEISPSSLRTMINVEDGATADQSAAEIVALIADQTIAPSTIDMEDDEKIKIGTGDDLEIYHSSNINYIDAVSNNLHIKASNLSLKSAAGETYLDATADGGVELFYDNSKKFETKSYGCSLVGNLQMTSADSQILKFGASDDLEIYHDGSTNIINGVYHPIELRHGAEVHIKCVDDGAVELYKDNKLNLATTGSGIKVSSPDGEATLQIEGYEGNAATLQFNADEGDDNPDFWRLRNGTGTDFSIENYSSGSWEKSIECNEDGNVELYHDNSKKFETYSGGCIVTGQLSTDAVSLGDGEKILLGSGDDIELYHDSADSHLVNKTGVLYIKNDAKFSIVAKQDAEVALYYNDSKKAETVTGGFTVTGTCTATAFSGPLTGNVTGTASVASTVTLVDESSDTSCYLVYAGGATGDKALETGSNLTFNSATGKLYATSFEGDGSSLTGISAGATGGSSDEVFWENGQTVTADYTITNNKNAMSAGPISINSSVTVTIGSGEVWIVV